METIRLIEIALLITVVIWMVITTLLFRSMNKSIVAVKDFETQVARRQIEAEKEKNAEADTLIKVVEGIVEETNDIYMLMKKFMEEANENKGFAIKTVLRAQEALKRCDAILAEVREMQNQSIVYPDVNSDVKEEAKNEDGKGTDA